MTLYNGSGLGGMEYFDTKDIYPHDSFHSITLPAGYEHKPLWFINEDGTPRKDRSIALYPYHRWKAGGIANSTKKNAYDIWVAFEMLLEECSAKL